VKGNLLFFILSFCAAHFTVAQNLVENSSFEKKTYCPSNYNLQRLTVVENWFQASDGTPDYFNACSDKVGVPKNMFGTQEASTGEAYVGFATYSPGKRNYREYMQTKLSRPLKAGELVCIEARISAADHCLFVTDGFGIYLSKEKISHERNQVISVEPNMSNPRLNMLDESHDWILVSDIYEAKGGEEFLTMGNFKMDRDLKIIKRTKADGAKEQNDWSYLFVDDITVKPVATKSECSCENEILASMVHDPPLELEEYETIQLDAILFDFDKFDINSVAGKQLEEIARLMKKNKSMYMEISGHTDIIGNHNYNDTLSLRRANQVIAHLTSKGIPKERMQVKYFGSNKPVASNETDEGRAQNRRVEFRIIEKKFELIQ
jgi:OOP family OmpA-OmpF porin